MPRRKPNIYTKGAVKRIQNSRRLCQRRLERLRVGAKAKILPSNVSRSASQTVTCSIEKELQEHFAGLALSKQTVTPWSHVACIILYTGKEKEFEGEYADLACHVLQNKEVSAKTIRHLMPLTSQLLMKGEQFESGILFQSFVNGFVVKYDKAMMMWTAERMSLGLAGLIIGSKKDDVQMDPIAGDAFRGITLGLEKALLDRVNDAHAENIRYIEEIWTGTFLKNLLDLHCLKWAGALDQILWNGHKGAFLANCSIYNESEAQVSYLTRLLLAKYCECWGRQHENVHDAIIQAVSCLKDGLDLLDNSCWECGMACKAAMHTCKGCKIAEYCGEACQRKAWNDGHMKKCKHFHGIFFSVVESFQLIDSAHSWAGQGVLQDLQLNKCSNYNAFSGAIYLLTQGMKSLGNVEGPSSRWFYSNMKRIQVEGWWGLDDTRFIFAREDLPESARPSEKSRFELIICLLCFDWFECEEIVDQVSYLCSLPAQNKSGPLCRRRFLEMYQGYGQDFFSTKKTWKYFHRALKKARIGKLAYFRSRSH